MAGPEQWFALAEVSDAAFGQELAAALAAMSASAAASAWPNAASLASASANHCSGPAHLQRPAVFGRGEAGAGKRETEALAQRRGERLPFALAGDDGKDRERIAKP